MSIEIVVAFIGAFGAISGVLIGWWLQESSRRTLASRENTQLIRFAGRLAEEITGVISQGFCTDEALDVAVISPRTVFPKHLSKDLPKLQENLQSIDAESSLALLWLIQTINNLESAIADLHDSFKKLMDNDDSYSSKSHQVVQARVLRAAKVSRRYSMNLCYHCKKSTAFIPVIWKFSNRSRQLYGAHKETSRKHYEALTTAYAKEDDT